MLYYRNYRFFYNIVYKDAYLHMKGGKKTPILNNEDFNISFYLYKIVKQLLHLSNVRLVEPFISFLF